VRRSPREISIATGRVQLTTADFSNLIPLISLSAHHEGKVMALTFALLTNTMNLTVQSLSDAMMAINLALVERKNERTAPR
jgi:hypothetical protein